MSIITSMATDGNTVTSRTRHDIPTTLRMAETKLATGSRSAEVSQFLQHPRWPHRVAEREAK
jgi:hypothetical protein